MSANQGSPDASGTESVVSNSIQEPSSGLDAGTAIAPTAKHRCVIISLIRHAQDDVKPIHLERLGQTHVSTTSYLPLQRAHDTARALSSHNKGHPDILIQSRLVERRYGHLVHRTDERSANEALSGKPSWSHRPVSRDYCPAEGGESMNMVAFRAELTTRLILNNYAVELSEAPEFFLEKKTTDMPAVLPDGIPHVVIVSHNVFLMELYEKMQSWEKEHSETNCDWGNAE